MKKVYHLTYWLFAALLISSCSLDDVDIGQKDSFVKFFDIGEGYAMEETSDGGFILIGTFEDITTTEAQIFKVDDAGNLEWVQRYDGFFLDGV